MRFYRKGSQVPSVGNYEAVDIALCYGWITGQAAPFDGRSWLGRFVPRRPRSIWSKVNRERALRLIREGRMRPSGLEEIRKAKQDGRWARAYSPPSTAKIPEDFLRELKKNKEAEAQFKRLDRANVYAVVFRLETTVNRELRKKKIKRIVEMFANGERFH